MICFVKVRSVGIVREEQEVKAKVARVLALKMESQSVLVLGETDGGLLAIRFMRFRSIANGGETYRK
jgi:hypothetical protein